MKTPREFRKSLYGFYDKHSRILPWREPEADGTFDPYKILISEIMLQQTQVSRVIRPFALFLERFPNVDSLGNADLAEVLAMWQGLGYNRRARYLRDSARIICDNYGGIVPNSEEQLQKLPGIGKNTAGAILAYAFNKPALFVETNIRTVYIHEYFAQTPEVIHDNRIIELLETTIDRSNPRKFYWALMDWGSYLKAGGFSQNTRSVHYIKQSKFEGSNRQLRGRVLRLLNTQRLTLEQLQKRINDDRLETVLAQLSAERLVQRQGKHFFIAS